MRDIGRLATLVLLLVFFSSSSEAQQFYAGNNMLRVFGCPSLDTLTIDGSGQVGECTNYQTGLIRGPAGERSGHESTDREQKSPEAGRPANSPRTSA